MPSVYLIHGTSTKEDDWFPWLEVALAPTLTLHRLSLPHPFAPTPAAWDAALDQQIPAEDKLTLITHSLGGITALRYLGRHQVTGARLILVAPFDQPLPLYPGLNSFLSPAPDYPALRAKLAAATVIVAKDDPIAPWQQGRRIAQQLDAKLITKAHGGHFLTSDGFRQFPLVEREVRRLINK